MTSGAPSSDAGVTGVRVLDAVIRVPKTLPADTTVSVARTALLDDHVQMLLLTHDGRLLGTLVRGDLPDRGDDDTLAVRFAVLEGRTVGCASSVDQARLLMMRRGLRRLAVVDDEGALVGLLCLKRRLTGFCSHGDVVARAGQVVADRRGGAAVD